MKNLTLKQLQQAELEVLVEIDRVCTELGLTYYLAYGTLLGAVRHQGFIPWDDDIDIWMLRKDYDVFVEKFTSKATSDFGILTAKDKGYGYPFAKVTNRKTEVVEKYFKKFPGLGTWVDVFPLDYMAEDHKEEDAKLTHLEHLRWMSFYKQSTFFTKIRWIYGAVTTKDISLKDIHNAPEEINSQISALVRNNKESDVVRVCKKSGLKEQYQLSWLGKGQRVEFEGHMLMAPDNSHEVLKMLYGDYMTLPPLKDRITGHHFKSSRFINGDK